MRFKRSKRPTYVVYDTTNYFIYCFPKTLTCAHSITLGLMDTERGVIQTDIPWVANVVSQFDLEEEVLQFCGNKLSLAPGEKWIRHFPKEQITQELIDRKNLALARMKYIYALESFLRVYTVKSVYTLEGSTVSYLLDALNKSNPETNEYSMGVMEYAHILDIDYRSAYEEIDIYIKSSGLLKIRAHAQYQKYVTVFNKCMNTDDLDAEYRKAWSELCSLCRI